MSHFQPFFRNRSFTRTHVNANLLAPIYRDKEVFAKKLIPTWTFFTFTRRTIFEKSATAELQNSYININRDKSFWVKLWPENVFSSASVKFYF